MVASRGPRTTTGPPPRFPVPPDGYQLLYTVTCTKCGAKIERYVPQAPLSTERIKHKNLLRALGLYRMALGQPRQEEFLQVIGNDAESRNLDWMRLDLGPQ